MYAFKIAIFVLAFVVAIASSAPVRSPRRRRDTCHPPKISSVAPAATLAVSVPASAPSGETAPSSAATTAKTASSQKPESTKESSPSSSSSSIPVLNNLIKALFPVSNSQSWSTSSADSKPLPMADSTFRPTNLISSLTHSYVQKEGKSSMQAHYPKGSWNFQQEPLGGISFYAGGPASVDLTTAKEATFGYSVFFPEGFDFVKGGKLPGLYGGDTAEGSVSCSGGARETTCFSARLMWRTNGAGELYTYLPPYTDSAFAANKKQCDVAPFSECNPTYGASVGRGSFSFATGQWTTISQRVRLNDPGQANGELQLFANGKSVINVSGLMLRDGSEGRIRGIQMQTFFGGSDSSWATPKDQDVWFSDFSAAITETL